jgi:hypothetical protein
MTRSQERFVARQHEFEEEWRCYLAALLRGDQVAVAELRSLLDREFGLRLRGGRR